jgi:hypothetical protein
MKIIAEDREARLNRDANGKCVSFEIVLARTSSVYYLAAICLK